MTWWHIGLVALAVWGVILNNHKHRGCFYVWFVTNLAWAVINWRHGLAFEALQNALFLALAIHGLWKWKKQSPSNLKLTVRAARSVL